MPFPRTHLKPTLKDLYDELDNREGELAELEAETDTTPKMWSAADIAAYVDSIVNPA